MPRRYFDNFPTVDYNGYIVTNLTTSAKLIDKYTNAPFTYYRTTVPNAARPDQIADSYYGDPYMSWMVYYSNKIVDPYYDWTLSDRNFQSFIEKKYGSAEVAIKTVVSFKVNWESDSTEMSPVEFANRFGDYTDPHSKYWNPIYDTETNRVLYYVRKVNDSVVNTNKLLKVGIANNDPTKFFANDLVDIRSVAGANVVATAQVLAVNTSTMFLKNLLGTTVANGYVICLDSNSDTYCTMSNYSTSNDTTLSAWTITNITDEEYIYWTPQTAYDIEVQENLDKMNIRLVQNGMAQKVADKLEEELGQ